MIRWGAIPERARLALLLAGAGLAGLALTLLICWLARGGTLIADWSHLEPWSGRSINVYRGTAPDAGVPPVPAVAIWAGLTSLCYVLLLKPWRGLDLYRLRTLLAVPVVGWAILDLRWQWELTRRLGATHAVYAGLDPSERRQAAPDGVLQPFLKQVRDRLPPDPAPRILILTQEPRGYLGSRVRYHLAPYNAFSGWSDSPDGVRVGDYLLLVAPVSSPRLDRRQGRLTDARHDLAVEIDYEDPRFGALLRVTEQP